MQIDSAKQLEFANAMRQSRLRLTTVRTRIFEVLITAKSPLPIQDIVKEIPEAHFVSVYRSIDVLLKAGIVKQVPQGFKNLFELSDTFKPHHHHATCESCGTSIEIHDKRVETLMKELTKEAGLAPTAHHFEMYGVCNNCSQ